MPTKRELQSWANGKVDLCNEFEALRKKEDRIVQQRVPKEWCYAYVSHPEPGEFGCWVANTPTERLRARFDLLATKAGIALGARPGIWPLTYWLNALYLDLRANGSSFIRMANDSGSFIERLFEASAIYCAQLDRRSLEDSCKEVKEGAALETVVEETVNERSERRSAVVMPILTSKRWSRGRLGTRAGVSKNSVYDYLSGKRNLSLKNREALAEELGLKLEGLPD